MKPMNMVIAIASVLVIFSVILSGCGDDCERKLSCEQPDAVGGAGGAGGIGGDCESSGTCVDGTPCEMAAACSSNMCSDGFCCDSACDGVCQGCNAAGNEGVCTPHAVGEDPEAECLVAASVASSCNGMSACGGEFLWSQGFGGSTYDWGSSVAVDAEGNLLVVGEFGNGNTVGLGGNSHTGIFVVKFNSAGEHIWSKSFGGASFEAGHSLAVDASGDVYVTGFYSITIDFGGGDLDSTNETNIFVLKLDSANGDHIWSKGFGGMSINAFDEGADIIVDSAGGVYVTGRYGVIVDFGGGILTSEGGTDIFIVKLETADGDHVWSKSFGDEFSDYSRGISVDAEGNVFVTGYFIGSINFGGATFISDGADIFLVKLDSGGNHIWSDTFGGGASASGETVAIDSSGNITIAGYFDGTVNFGGGSFGSAGQDDIFLAKFATNGAHLWSKRFGGTEDDRANSVTVDAIGNILVTGYYGAGIDFEGGTLISAGNSDIFVAGFGPSGTHRWSRRFGGVGEDIGRSLAASTTNDVFVTGSYSDSVDFGGGAISTVGDLDAFILNLAP